MENKFNDYEKWLDINHKFFLQNIDAELEAMARYFDEENNGI